MKYFLCRFKFLRGVHFGESEQADNLSTTLCTFHADTLFSALCITALNVGGENRLNSLVSTARQDKLVFSDAFPYQGETLYLPKPLIPPRTHLKSQDSIEPRPPEANDPDQKKLKAIRYLPVCLLDDYCRYLNGISPFPQLQENRSLGRSILADHVQIKQEADNLPFSVGVYYFTKESGLYVIMGCDQEETANEIKQLLTLLGISGLGGKISSGLGEFHCEVLPLAAINSQDAKELQGKLSSSKYKNYNMLLTSALPREEELASVIQNGYFMLIRRGGFIQTQDSKTQGMKKKTQFFLSAGSIVANRFVGDVYNVNQTGGHPVYRYSKPVFVEVEA